MPISIIATIISLGIFIVMLNLVMWGEYSKLERNKDLSTEKKSEKVAELFICVFAMGGIFVIAQLWLLLYPIYTDKSSTDTPCQELQNTKDK